MIVNSTSPRKLLAALLAAALSFSGGAALAQSAHTTAQDQGSTNGTASSRQPGDRPASKQSIQQLTDQVKREDRQMRQSNKELQRSREKLAKAQRKLKSAQSKERRVASAERKTEKGAKRAQHTVRPGESGASSTRGNSGTPE